MKIDFKNREETVIQNFYDGEGALSARMFLDGDNLHPVWDSRPGRVDRPAQAYG